jgi:hypothetical protein
MNDVQKRDNFVVVCYNWNETLQHVTTTYPVLIKASFSFVVNFRNVVSRAAYGDNSVVST